MNEPLLTIGYSVLAERTSNIRLPRQRPDTEVLVVVQGATPREAPVRDDVRYVELNSRGVAKSRNEVLRRSRGKFVMFADDDVVLVESGVRRLLTALLQDDDLALAQGSAIDGQGRLRKRYSRQSVRLHRWNAAKTATYEMMVRRIAFADAGVFFDEAFGAGAGARYLGDEYVFIADALRAGLRCRFFPITVAQHDIASSGSDFGSLSDAAARAAVFGRVFRHGALVARFAFLLRNAHRFKNLGLMIRFVCGRFDEGDTSQLPKDNHVPHVGP